MAGIDMMLKSMLGIDPAQLKQQFEHGVAELGKTLKHFNDKLSVIEKQQTEILRLLQGGQPQPLTNGVDHGDKAGAETGNDGDGERIAVNVRPVESSDAGGTAGKGGTVHSPQVPARVSRRAGRVG